MSTTREENAMKNTDDFNLQERRARRRTLARNAVVYTLLALWAVVVLFPFYFMILTSLKSYGSYNAEAVPQLITLTPTLRNYFDAFSAVPLADYFLNTLIFTLATTAIMLIVTVDLSLYLQDYL